MDHHAEYDAMLDEMFPLNGINYCPFSVLLEKGDPIAYELGFSEWYDSQNFEEDKDD